jgi:hypothetical protein
MFYAVGLGIAVHDGETFTRDPSMIAIRVICHLRLKATLWRREHINCLLFVRAQLGSGAPQS